MAGIVVLAGCMWFGASIVRLTGVRLSREERAVVGGVTGLAAGSWVVYLLASSAGELSWGVLISALAVFAVTGYAAVRLRPRTGPREAGYARWFLGLAAVLGGALAFLNLWGIMATGPNGGVLAGEHIWADLPFHTSILTSFAYRPNYPPTYPLALGEPLGYPFLVDFLSGVLVHTGMSVRLALVVVNVVIQLAFFLAVALIALRLTGSRRAAVLSAVLLFGLGNLGWLAIPHDVREAGGVGRWLSALPWSYTGDALGDKGRTRLGTGIYLGNPTFIYFLPRRSAAFGLAAGASMLLVLDDLIERRRAGAAVLGGVLLGLMPRIHAHSVMAMLAFVGVWFLLLPARKGPRTSRTWLREWWTATPVWALMGAIALALALPQVIAMSRQSVGFVSWWPGWTGEPHEALAKIGAGGGGPAAAAAGRAVSSIVRFWVLNGGLLVFLVVAALRGAKRDRWIFYAPVAVLWLFANVVRTQPWEWDNNNFFVYWQMGSTILAAAWLAPLLREAPWAVPPQAPDRAVRVARPLAAGVLIAGLTLGGVLSLVYGAQQRLQLWPKAEEAVPAWIREHTAPDAVVLTSNGHEHPVTALAGRQTYMGFPGWFVSHGLPWAEYEARLVDMYAGNVELMRSLGVDYVVIGPWERGLAADKRFELAPVFDDRAVFEEVYRATPGGQDWRVLRLRSASRAAPAS